MTRVLVLFTLLAACGPTSVPFGISMRLQRDETSEMCPTNSCDLVALGCDAKVSLRIINAEEPNIVYLSKCIVVQGGDGINLCAIADINDMIGDVQIPNTMVQIQLAVWSAPPGSDDTECPVAAFSDDGLVSTTVSPAPALGGASYFQVGSASVATVTLGCVNVPALDDPVCALPNGLNVLTNVLDETGLSVSGVTTNRLHVFVGEPSFDSTSGDFELPSSEATPMLRTNLEPIPLWKANVPGFDQSACIEVDTTSTQGTVPTTLTCALVDPQVTEMMIDGTVFLDTTPAALQAALGTLPPTGLVYGRVVDHTGTFAAGVTVTATQGTVLYLNDTLDSTNDGSGQPLTATTASGAFLSLDAPYEVGGVPNQWAATDGNVVSEGTVIGGRVTGMVSIVQMRLADPGSTP